MKHRIDELTGEMTKLRDSHSSMYQILTEKDNQLDAMLIENRQNGAIIEQQKHQAKMQVSPDVSCFLVSRFRTGDTIFDDWAQDSRQDAGILILACSSTWFMFRKGITVV